ncbi:dynamin family protein, partial [Chromatium okenii]
MTTTMIAPAMSTEALESRYRLLCRACHTDVDDSPVQHQLATELKQLQTILLQDLPALARRGSPDNFADLWENLKQELERFHEFCEFPDLAQKVVVGLGGAFSAGKSSFINALLGQKRLVTEVDETTSLPTYLLHGSEEHITALNLFKRRVRLSQAEFLSLTHDEKLKYGSQVSALLYSAFVSVPEFTFRNLALLDTPGYSKPDDPHWHERSDAHLARSQLNSAQFLIWLISAEAGTISEADLKFLASLRPGIPRLIIISRADKR